MAQSVECALQLRPRNSNSPDMGQHWSKPGMFWLTSVEACLTPNKIRIPGGGRTSTPVGLLSKVASRPPPGETDSLEGGTPVEDEQAEGSDADMARIARSKEGPPDGESSRLALAHLGELRREGGTVRP